MLAMILARLLPYRGRHRGSYTPSEHWRHTTCSAKGCTMKINITFHNSPVEAPDLVVLQ